MVARKVKVVWGLEQSRGWLWYRIRTWDVQVLRALHYHSRKVPARAAVVKALPEELHPDAVRAAARWLAGKREEVMWG